MSTRHLSAALVVAAVAVATLAAEVEVTEAVVAVVTAVETDTAAAVVDMEAVVVDTEAADKVVGTTAVEVRKILHFIKITLTLIHRWLWR